MSEDTVNTSIRSSYNQFTKAMDSVLSSIDGSEREGAVNLATKVIAAIDSLPERKKNSKTQRERREIAEGFLQAYGPMQESNHYSPEAMQLIHDKICSTGVYAPVW